MATAKVKVDSKAVRDILRSQEVLRHLSGKAKRIEGAAGPGHRTEADIGRNRARAAVITDTTEARLNEARHHTLLRALDAGRG